MIEEIERSAAISGFTFYLAPAHGVSVFYGDQCLTLPNAGEAMALMKGLAEALQQHGYDVKVEAPLCLRLNP